MLPIFNQPSSAEGSAAAAVTAFRRKELKRIDSRLVPGNGDKTVGPFVFFADLFTDHQNDDRLKRIFGWKLE